MSALTFTLKSAPENRLDCRALTPDKLAGLDAKQIAALPLYQQRNSPKVSDYFNVSGDDARQIIFAGDCEKLDFIGAGMKSGTIICKGNVGNRLADSMRRGLILVDGDAGSYAASRMIAGTVGIYGKVGDHLGFAMKRGTILLTQKPNFHATIVDCGVHQLGFLPLLLRSFATLETRFKDLKPQPVHKYAGDVGVNGKSEILIF